MKLFLICRVDLRQPSLLMWSRAWQWSLCPSPSLLRVSLSLVVLRRFTRSIVIMIASSSLLPLVTCQPELTPYLLGLDSCSCRWVWWVVNRILFSVTWAWRTLQRSRSELTLEDLFIVSIIMLSSPAYPSQDHVNEHSSDLHPVLVILDRRHVHLLHILQLRSLASWLH